jgi:hypothetical protein
MLMLPMELLLAIFRLVKQLIGQIDFKLDGYLSMQYESEYYRELLSYALVHRSWVGLAQSELFRRVVLRNKKKTELLLNVLRTREELAEYAHNSIAIRFGTASNTLWPKYDGEGLKDALDEIKDYCPEIVEISCVSMTRVQLGDFRTLYLVHLIID